MQLDHDSSDFISALLIFLNEACGVSHSCGQATGFSPLLKEDSKAHQQTVFSNRRGLVVVVFFMNYTLTSGGAFFHKGEERVTLVGS